MAREELSRRLSAVTASGGGRQQSPNTGNGWLSILRVIFKRAMLDFELTKNPMSGIEKFDASTWSTYAEEEAFAA